MVGPVIPHAAIALGLGVVQARSIPPAGEERGHSEGQMFPRSGPRTDGSCAEGPRVGRFDEEARPTYDPARGAERPGRTPPPQLFLKTTVPCYRICPSPFGPRLAAHQAGRDI